MFFFFNDTATTEIYTLSLHDALPISFGLNVNKISHPVKTARGYYLIKVIEKVPIDEANFEAQKNTLRQTILSRKQQQAFIDWFNDLKAKARIKDLRQNA